MGHSRTESSATSSPTGAESSELMFCEDGETGSSGLVFWASSGLVSCAPGDDGTRSSGLMFGTPNDSRTESFGLVFLLVVAWI